MKNTILYIYTYVYSTYTVHYKLVLSNSQSLSLWNEFNRQKKVVVQVDQTSFNEAGVFEFEISKNCTTSE